MAYALGLPDALRARGLKVEVVPGWETRSAGSFNPKGAVCHWTAGPKNSVSRPSLHICTYGREGLPGPLCQVYGARDGTAVVVAAGRANHAGVGGWKGLVGNSAVFGTEMEAAGVDDFTPEQRWAYPRINAAYCDIGGFGADMICGHSEWAGRRKTDINGYTMDDLRREVASFLTGEDDDMFGPQHEQMLTDLHAMMGAFQGGPEVDIYKPFFVSTSAAGTAAALRTEGVSGAADVARMAEALAPALTVKVAEASDASPAGTITRRDVEDVLNDFFAARVKTD